MISLSRKPLNSIAADQTNKLAIQAVTVIADVLICLGGRPIMPSREVYLLVIAIDTGWFIVGSNCGTFFPCLFSSFPSSGWGLGMTMTLAFYCSISTTSSLRVCACSMGKDRS